MRNLLISFILIFSISSSAYAAFDPSFIELARSLEGKHPELFKGFKDTDFEALEMLQKQKASCVNPYIETHPRMFDALIERIGKYKEDAEQAKLLRELETYRANDDLNYLHYIIALIRHQTLIRIKAGEACEFEKFTTELGNRFGEKLFSALTSGGSFTNMYKAFYILDELLGDDIVMSTPSDLDNDEDNKEESLDHVAFPLYGHHEVGVVYLAYMFSNRAFPIAYPEEQGEGRLHGMTMSVYAEFVHDALHMRGYLNIDGAEDVANQLMKAYVEFLREKRNELDADDHNLEQMKNVSEDSRHHTFSAIFDSIQGEDKELKRNSFIQKLYERYGASFVRKIISGLNQTHDILVHSDNGKADALKYKALAEKLEAKLPPVDADADGNQGGSAAEFPQQKPSKSRFKKPLSYPNPRDIKSSVVDTLKEKEDIIREMANVIFLSATKSFSTGSMSEARYKTLMVGLFNRLHEDYFDGEEVLKANTAEGVLKAFFKKSERVIKLDGDETTRDEAAADDKAEAEGETVPRNNPFQMNFVDGQSVLSDDEILELAARMPASMFVEGNYNPYATLIGGKVTRKTHLMGIELFAEDGAIYKMLVINPKAAWMLNAEHDTSLVNMGRGDVDGLSELTVPDLSAYGDNHAAANKVATEYLQAVADGMDKIYERACFVSTFTLGLDGSDAVNKALANFTAKLEGIFPKDAHAKVFAKEAQTHPKASAPVMATTTTTTTASAPDDGDDQ